MKVLGVDIDGTLLGKRAEQFYDIVDRLRQEIVDGTEAVLVTSRFSSAEGQQLVWDQWGINLPCIAVTRDWPSLKGEYLIRYRDALGDSSIPCELWDDESWYLDPAYVLGIKCFKVIKGQLQEYVGRPHTWQPKTPKPPYTVTLRG